jgi:hypothetical protein
MDKLSHDAPQKPADSPGVATVPALLRELGAKDHPVDQQRNALRGWLLENTPGQGLRFSLRRNGYGLVLDETDESKGIPRRKRR